jgi:type II secretory pathway pseudopilin PulG
MTTYRGRLTNSKSEGFTLIELLISSGLAIIVVTIGSGILLNGIRTQDNAQTVTDAANTAQQVVRSIQAGVRNASAITLQTGPLVGTQLLLARTVGSDPNSTIASCQAWYYTPENGGVVYSIRTTPASAISLPAGGPMGSWTVLGTGITPADPITGKVFGAPSGGRVELKFDVFAGSHPYVLINTMTYASRSTTVSAPCF